MSAVSLSSRTRVEAAGTGGEESAPASPPASRLRHSRWRDPRLWFGTLLVLASVVVGARVLAAADDTVGVWTLDHDVSAGMRLGASDLRVTRLHFSNAADESHYWLAQFQLPAQAHVTRDVGAGELLAKAAVSTDAAAVPHQLPLSVPAAGMPVNVAPGDHVEIWAVPKPEAARSRPRLLLGDTVVLSVGEPTVAGLGSDRQVVVALPSSADTGSVLDGLNGAAVVMVRTSG
jgi:hypothetical protein